MICTKMKEMQYVKIKMHMKRRCRIGEVHGEYIFTKWSMGIMPGF